ncbi:hypothetical protein D5086_018701 [Populus alba]|uniref:Uncharacterized protein n=1 Tax=Populus alba TaxID=43335 RepID=A0ACC4BS36_POPAL
MQEEWIMRQFQCPLTLGDSFYLPFDRKEPAILPVWSKKDMESISMDHPKKCIEEYHKAQVLGQRDCSWRPL